MSIEIQQEEKILVSENVSENVEENQSITEAKKIQSESRRMKWKRGYERVHKEKKEKVDHLFLFLTYKKKGKKDKKIKQHKTLDERKDKTNIQEEENKQ